MDLKHLTTFMALYLCLLLSLATKSIALLGTDLETFISTPVLIDGHFHNGNIKNCQSNKVVDNRQKRDYDYIDYGNTAPENPTDRRSSDSDDSYNSYGENQNTKPKKLFVPNFFG